MTSTSTGRFRPALLASCLVGAAERGASDSLIAPTVTRTEARRGGLEPRDTLALMQGNEAVQAALEAAQHKLAQIDHLGPRYGAGATVWARMASDELARHEAARERFSDTPSEKDWHRVHGTALLLIVAIDQVLAFESRVRKVTGDADLAKARKQFGSRAPHAEALRDLVAHLDEYAVGEGWRQIGNAQPPIAQRYIETFLYWTDSDSTIVRIGEEELNLRSAVEAAVALAEVVERVRRRHLERAAQDANTAFSRRWRMPE